MLTQSDVQDKMFRVALRGYAEEEVDAFLDLIEVTLGEWESDKRGELKPQDVEQKTFRVALRGYAEEEVDQFLDEIVDTLREYERREIEQPTQPVPVSGVTEEGPGPPAAHPHTDVPAQPAAPVVVGTPVQEPPTAPGPTPTITRLVVTRTAESGGRPYTVLLDDRQIGKISPGGTERFEIPTGMHWVTMKTRKQRSNNQVIEPHEGDQITLTCGPASGEVDDLGRRMEGITLGIAV